MTSEEQSGAPAPAGSASSRRAGPPRRRRSFRPGRRPPRRNLPGQAAQPTEQEADQRDLPPAVAGSAETDSAVVADSTSADAPPPFRPPENRKPTVPATPVIQEAIETVQRINKELEVLLLEMQKALEILEEAEVQKYADEREIESLRAAVRQLNRPRENQQRPHQSQGRPDQRNRHSHRDQRFQSSHRARPEQRLPEKGPEPAPADDHVEPRDSGEESHREPPQDRDVPF